MILLSIILLNIRLNRRPRRRPDGRFSARRPAEAIVPLTSPLPEEHAEARTQDSPSVMQAAGGSGSGFLRPLLFIPLIAVTGVVAWAVRLWIGRQQDPARAHCRVAQVGFGLVVAVFMIELSGRIWSFSMGRDTDWVTNPSEPTGFPQASASISRLTPRSSNTFTSVSSIRLFGHDAPAVMPTVTGRSSENRRE